MSGEVRLVPKGGDYRIGHGHRTKVTGLDLVPGDHLGRPGHVRPRTRVGPRRGVQAAPDGRAHELVVCGVVVDHVDAVPETVVGTQLGTVHVGQSAELEGVRLAGEGTERVKVARSPGRAFPARRIGQRPVGGEQVVTLERRRLIEHLMGLDVLQHGSS